MAASVSCSILGHHGITGALQNIPYFQENQNCHHQPTHTHAHPTMSRNFLTLIALENPDTLRPVRTPEPRKFGNDCIMICI